MIFNILTSFVAIAAFILSCIAFFGTRNTRRREWRIEANKIAAETGHLLSGLDVRGRKLGASWDALFAANGTYKSSLREGRIAEINAHISKVKKLSGQLSKASDDMNKLDDSGLEKRIIELRFIQLESQAVSDWMDEKEEEHRQGVQLRRVNRQDRPPRMK